MRVGLTVLLMVLTAISAVAVTRERRPRQGGRRRDRRRRHRGHVWNLAKWPVLLLVVSLCSRCSTGPRPNVKQPGFRWITPGGVLAVLGWVIASAAFAFYVSNFGSYNKTYGALAGPIVFLVWLWISNVMILLGAEFNAELERSRAIEAGMRPEDKEPFVEPRDTRKLENHPSCLLLVLEHEQLEADVRVDQQLAVVREHLAAERPLDHSLELVLHRLLEGEPYAAYLILVAVLGQRALHRRERVAQHGDQIPVVEDVRLGARRPATVVLAEQADDSVGDLGELLTVASGRCSAPGRFPRVGSYGAGDLRLSWRRGGRDELNRRLTLPSFARQRGHSSEIAETVGL